LVWRLHKLKLRKAVEGGSTILELGTVGASEDMVRVGGCEALFDFPLISWGFC
jgi:hypothetical protein